MDILHSITNSKLRNKLVPALLSSTASLTHIRLKAELFSPPDLVLLTDAFPSLVHLEIAQTHAGHGSSADLQDQGWIQKDDPELVDDIDLGIGIATYPRFTPTVTENFLAPLARLSSLQYFAFGYLSVLTVNDFTLSDLSQVAQWRDVATPDLWHIQINHMRLTKGGDGRWTQDMADYWADWKGVADFVDVSS